MTGSKLHDIRNKVTALESQIYMLKKSIEQADNEKTQTYIARMEKTLNDLKDELAGLHDVTKAAD